MRARGGSKVVKAAADAAAVGHEEAVGRLEEIKEQQQQAGRRLGSATGKANGQKGAKKMREDAAGTPPHPHTRTPDSPKRLRPLPFRCSRAAAARLGEDPSAERRGGCVVPRAPRFQSDQEELRGAPGCLPRSLQDHARGLPDHLPEVRARKGRVHRHQGHQGRRHGGRLRATSPAARVSATLVAERRTVDQRLRERDLRERQAAQSVGDQSV